MTNIIIILNIILLEIILSIDNASALSLMVRHLPKEQQSKALKYGIIGAYVFRGLCLILVAYLLEFEFLKLLGGSYLIYLTYNFFKTQSTENETKKESKKLGFWQTVIMVEIMDLAFSIDNVFAVVAMTPNLTLIIIGVFIGILAMRFIAVQFIKLIETYPKLEKAAFIVIGFLGIKLCLSYLVTFTGNSTLIEIINGHTADLISSLGTMIVFIYPVIEKTYATIKSKKRTNIKSKKRI